jgi:transcriptional regulator with XRE-family HTH domain
MTYLRLERGDRVPDITQLARICGALGLPLSVFLARVEERKPEDAPGDVDASTREGA